MCYLLAPLAHAVTNFPVRKNPRNDYNVQDVAYRYTNLRSSRLS